MGNVIDIFVNKPSKELDYDLGHNSDDELTVFWSGPIVIAKWTDGKVMICPRDRLGHSISATAEEMDLICLEWLQAYHPEVLK